MSADPLFNGIAGHIYTLVNIDDDISGLTLVPAIQPGTIIRLAENYGAYNFSIQLSCVVFLLYSYVCLIF